MAISWWLLLAGLLHSSGAGPPAAHPAAAQLAELAVQLQQQPGRLPEALSALGKAVRLEPDSALWQFQASSLSLSLSLSESLSV